MSLLAFHLLLCIELLLFDVSSAYLPFCRATELIGILTRAAENIGIVTRASEMIGILTHATEIVAILTCAPEFLGKPYMCKTNHWNSVSVFALHIAISC